MVSCRNCGCDVCVWGGVNARGIFAPIETAIFQKIVGDGCRNGSTVVDVGANVGYFTLIAGGAGCRAISFEPQPVPRAMALASVALNGMASRVSVHAVAIAAVRGTGSVGTGGSTWGTNAVTASAGDGGDLEFRPLSDFVDSDVLLLKVDTEGFEDQVVAGSKAVFLKHIVHNVVMEVKERDTKARRDMLRQMMVDAGLKHAYCYREDYEFTWFMQQGSDLALALVDVTSIILDRSYYALLPAEDMWFTREKLAFVG